MFVKNTDMNHIKGENDSWFDCGYSYAFSKIIKKNYYSLTDKNKMGNFININSC